ncbi:MAG: hypothetical protein ACREMX_15355 [Gemmatimonadales bacterium]
MRVLLTALVAGALLAACETKADRDTGAVEGDRSGTDTLIQSERVKDTTVVEADTSIDVDTVEKTDNLKENK